MPSNPRLLLLLADLLVALHLAIVLFIVLGELLILAGGWLRWRWVRARRFRFAHLAAIALVVGCGIYPGYCPLTLWEYDLRVAAGQPAEAGSFVGRLIQEILFYEWPGWIFLPLYAAFLLLVIASWIWIRPRRRA